MTTDLVPFDYVILRAAPRIQRGEFVNVGAVLYCRALDFLGAAWDVVPDRLKALDPAVDVDVVCASLSTSARSVLVIPTVVLQRRPGSASDSGGSRLHAVPSYIPDRSTAGSPTTPPRTWTGCWTPSCVRPVRPTPLRGPGRRPARGG